LEEENRAPAKEQLEKKQPATARMLGDFLQHQRINPVLPLPQGPICLLGLGAGKMAKHPWDEKEALSY